MARRRNYTIDEYSALKTAYGKNFTRKDIISDLVKPFIVVGVYTFLLYYYWWLSIILGLVASLYQYRRVMVLNARREYEQEAFNQRNHFINNLTQILTNPTTTTLDGMLEVKNRAKGEFKDDLTVLLTGLKDADPSKLRELFEEFKSGYQKDVVFLQYVDQLETALLDGRNNIDILKDIRSFHNNVKVKRDIFIDKKNIRKTEFFKTTGMVLLLMVFLAVMMGFDTYLTAYAHTPIGWVCNSLFLLCIFLVFRKHLKRQEDDEVMEVDL